MMKFRVFFISLLLTALTLCAFADGKLPDIYGSRIYPSPYGLFKIPTTADGEFEVVKQDANLRAAGGGFYVDGLYYCIRFTNNGSQVLGTFLSVYDTETGEYIEEATSVDASMISYDVTYDPLSELAYGCFYRENYSGACWASYDPYAKEKKEIRTLTGNEKLYMVACNANGEIYGVNYGNNLVKIDKLTGEQTVIGNTGLKPAYIQSGDFDKATGVLYWAASLSDGTSGLYTIDLKTGKATEVCKYPKNEEVAGMYIPFVSSNLAPTSVSVMRTQFENGSTEGTFYFKAPRRNNIGENLSSDAPLTYTLMVNGEEYKGEVMPDAEVEIPLKLTKGMHTFVINTANSYGKSDNVSIEKWIGADQPSKVSDLVASLADNGVVHITWIAPTTSLHGGWMDKENLTYDITRNPGNEPVASGVKGTSYDDAYSTQTLANYTYVVTPVAGGEKGEPNESNAIQMGEYLKLPYSLVSADDFKLWTVIDCNKDTKTWEWNANIGGIRTTTSSMRDCDEWAITPAIPMQNDRYYRISMTAGNPYPQYYDEQFSVYLGKDNTADAMTIEVMPSLTVKEKSLPVEMYAKVDENGVYNIGLHGESKVDVSYQLQISKFVVEEGPKFTSPEAPYALEATAGALGKLMADISFTVPQKTLNGAALASVDSVMLYRNDVLVKVFNGVKPGETVTWTDNDANDKWNEYKAVAVNADGKGYPAVVKIYCGLDVPLAPEKVYMAYANGALNITWDKPLTTGVNGGYVDTDALTYKVYALNGTRRNVVLEDLTANQCSIECPLEGSQEWKFYYVAAVNSIGESDYATTNGSVIGELYEMPFKDGFAGGKTQHEFWGASSENGNGEWSISADYDYNGDGGAAVFKASAAGDRASLITGSITLDTAEKPSFSTYYMAAEGGKGQIAVSATCNGGGEMVELGNADIVADGKWHKLSVDLASLNGNKFANIYITVVADNENTVIAFDKVRVANVYAKDLEMIALNAEKRVQSGSDVKVDVMIENVGKETVSDYSVDVYFNNVVVESIDGMSIAPDSALTLTASLPTTIFDKTDIAVYAAINFADDEFVGNNTSDTQTTRVIQSLMPAPSKVELTASEHGDVDLKWTAPDLTEGIPEIVTEDFESYEAFSLNSPGEWTLYDADAKKTYGVSGIDYPNKYDPKSFFIVDVNQYGITNNEFWSEKSAHSGSKVLVSFEPYESQNDDWIISPRLSGKKQTISFYAAAATMRYGNEELCIMTTTSEDKAPENFRQVFGSNTQISNDVNTDGWREYSYAIPENTTYFAIRCTSKNRFALLIDDITYQSANDATPADLELTDYNIWRDKEKIATVKGTETSFLDKLDESGKYEYGVSAVYNYGESSPVMATANVTVGIQLLTKDAIASAKPAKGAIVVEAESGTPVILYSANGSCLTSFAAEGGKQRLDVAPGYYVVKVGRTTTSMQIK